ncbi:MAG TPA: hypothetical protein VFV66_18735 [Nonomuraea sp.]|nr:hypothetical protein [Nonomuraea sp.]
MSTITLLTGQPDLPEAWWRSLPMPHVLAAIGPDPLGELLTEICLECWPAAAVGDILPALHVLDPDDADEPAVAIAIDRAGSWTGLLRLTSRELVDQPFVQARPVLNTLFAAVFTRMARPPAVTATEPAAPLEGVPAEQGEGDPEAAPGREGAEGAVPSPAEGGAEGGAEDEPAGAGARVVDAEVEPVAEAGDGPEHVLHAAEEPAADSAPADDAEATDDDERVDYRPQFATAGPEQTAGDEAPAGDEPSADDEAPAGDERPASDEQSPSDGAPASDGDSASGKEPAEEASPAAASAASAEEPEERPESPAVRPKPVRAGSRQELTALIEAAFAGLDDKSWAVAQNRVFTDEPSAVDQLAKLFAVPPAEISATETEFRARLEQWLASEEAAPYRAHLEELRRTLGPAAPKERLIGAADWHRVEIRALEVPAWQFVLATLPGQPRAQQAPPVEQPPVEQPPMEQPPVEQSAVEQAAVEQAAVEQAARPQPPIEFPPMDLPAHSAFGPVPMPPPPPGPPQFQAFTPVAEGEANGGSGEQKPYQPLKDVSQTRRCFRQPDGRWWLRIDVTAEQLAGGECALPTGFAAYLGLSPGETKTVRSAAGELTMAWHGRPVLESIERLLADVGAREGGHLFLTLSDEGVLRARHLPVAAQGAEQITKALRLVGYTAPGGTRDQAARVIATRIGMTGPVSLPDLLTRLRERGDRDLLALLD